MKLQGYMLAVVYLAFGAGLLLVDYYGGRLLLLIRVRNSLRDNRTTQTILVSGGVLIAALKTFFPIDPGPILLGDFIPAAVSLVLSLYYLYQAVTQKKKQKDSAQEQNGRFNQEVLEKTGALIETNKRNLGFVVLGFSILHFLLPQFVLL